MTLFSHNYIRQQANNLINQFGITEPPIDLKTISDGLGIEIIELSLPSWFFGALVEIEDEFYIVLNRIMPDTRKIFTIAHEIAHYQMHNDKIAYMKNTKRPYFHTEADIFAA